MSRPSPSGLVRLALRPQWLMAAVVVLVLAIAGGFLGRWQWDRTQSILAAERAARAEPIAIQEALGDGDELPADSIGRPVTLSGSYEPAVQVAVTSRAMDGVPGVWIVTGFRLTDGRTVAVLRGWLESADSPGAVAATGPMAVSGVLQPDESFYANAVTPAGTVASIDHERLSQQWGRDVATGYVVLTSQNPAQSPAPAPVAPSVQTADVPFPLQNFVYAFQWWLFALFGVAVFGRWLWVEARRRREEQTQVGGA